MNVKRYFMIACLLFCSPVKPSEHVGDIACLDQRAILSTFLSQQGEGFQAFFKELQAGSKQELRRNPQLFCWSKVQAEQIFAQSMATLRTQQLDPTTVDHLMASMRVFRDEREKQEAKRRSHQAE